jgi:hypothetical protein
LNNPYLDEDIRPLALSETEIDDMIAFLASLTNSAYNALGADELARQTALSLTSRPQRDTARAFGPKIPNPVFSIDERRFGGSWIVCALDLRTAPFRHFAGSCRPAIDEWDTSHCPRIQLAPHRLSVPCSAARLACNLVFRSLRRS